MASTIGFAADLLSSPMCMPKDAITSSAPNALPLWNVTPERRLNVQVFASADASQLSASSPFRDPSAATSVRLSKTDPCAQASIKISECVRLSQLSDVFAPPKPAVNLPPLVAALSGIPVIDKTPAAAPVFIRPRLLIPCNISFSLVDLRRIFHTFSFSTCAVIRDYILHTAASPMLSTPRSCNKFVSQSGSISGTDDSNKSVYG